MAGELLVADRHGRLVPLDNKKADPPKTGNAFGNWAGRDITYAQLPGGGVVQFDLSKLTLQDFRNMRDHYQINASLSVLGFMLHQADFHIECDDKKIADFCEQQFRDNWTMLNRSMNQANWAGFAPSVLDWENNLQDRSVDLSKIKDMVPEECLVRWKEIEGWSPPDQPPQKFKVFDGFKHAASRYPIPAENSLWYPVLMENGDYYGRKLLRPAFQSWFFSILIHLFANRYMERFGEPVPIGRAPYDDEIQIGGQRVKGNEFLLTVLDQLRSRSVVVLPNDHDTDNNGKPIYDYDISYLESQMRGADFERYLTRLDEEMSIGTFMPILLFRTADVGSYDLGKNHYHLYQMIISALNDDRKMYYDNFVLTRLVDFNFSPNAPRAKIIFRKQGAVNQDMIQALILALLTKDKVKLDIKELGEIAGLTLKEQRALTAPPPAPGTDPNAPNGGDTAPAPSKAAGNDTETRIVAQLIRDRVRGQIDAAYRNGNPTEMKIDMGYRRRVEQALQADGHIDATIRAGRMYQRLDAWAADVVAVANSYGPDSFMAMFDRALNAQILEAVDAAEK